MRYVYNAHTLALAHTPPYNVRQAQGTAYHSRKASIPLHPGLHIPHLTKINAEIVHMGLNWFKIRIIGAINNWRKSDLKFWNSDQLTLRRQMMVG